MNPKDLTENDIHTVLGDCYLRLVRETKYNGGMGGTTWDLAAARAIEAEVRSRLAAATPVASPTEPKDCPHAAPFRYCETCKVSPCPVGLGRP